MKSFRAKDRSGPVRIIDFELADDVYHFKAGTTGDALLGMVMAPRGNKEDLEITRNQFNWLANGLDPTHNTGHEPAVEGCQACRLQSRMMDPNDHDVDFDVVIEVIQWLTQEVAARPTTSSSV